MCSEEFCKINRKTPIPEFLFNEVAGYKSATLLKKWLRYKYLTVSFVKFLRLPDWQSTPDNEYFWIKASFIFPEIAFVKKNLIYFGIVRSINWRNFHDGVFVDLQLHLEFCILTSWRLILGKNISLYKNADWV